ncbi:helix-turn-helix domain-containing protein [Mucilaginibacter sp. SMC90]|uniref:helix-turn-helix domain-containing protein n=1 Tax=Mucilaginibacter sp. SMC90 TaxID=2929803 RepID=UPI00353016EB
MRFLTAFHVISNIRRIRIQKNISKSFISQKLGITLRSYSSMEQGKKKITLEHIFIIAPLLQTDVFSLLCPSHMIVIHSSGLLKSREAV